MKKERDTESGKEPLVDAKRDPTPKKERSHGRGAGPGDLDQGDVQGG